MAKCNIDGIADAAILARFSQYLTPQEEEQMERKFTPLCFFETWGTKNHRECFCTCCKRYISVWKSEDPAFFKHHHNDTSTCPECGETVLLKSLGRIKNFENLRETIPATFLRVDDGGNLMISAGIGVREIPGWNDLDPVLYFRAKAAYYLSPGRVMGWRKSCWFYRETLFGPQTWQPMKNICKPFQNNPYYGHTDEYWFFGTEHLADSKFRYCQLEEWYYALTYQWIPEQESKVRLCVEYLAEYALHPQVEMAVKLGLNRAVADLCEGRKNHADLNWRADKPWKFLRLSKPDAKYFLASPSLSLLRWIHLEQKQGSSATVQQMTEIWNTFGGEQAKKLASCAVRCHISARKAMQYIASQTQLHKNQTAELWFDYLDMAQKLNYDLTRPDVLMPKNLAERHDAAAQTLRLEQDEKAAKQYAKRLKILRETYEFAWNGLQIVVPETASQIVEEGRTLKHCVGGYAPRHMEGKTVILFLRRSRKPNTPFVTIEMCGLQNTNIRQIHGYQNELYAHSVQSRKRYAAFLQVWQTWLQAGSRRDSRGQPVLPSTDGKEVVA